MASREHTEWHHITIFDEQLAAIAWKYLRKGSKVYLEGRLHTGQLEDHQGQQRSTTEIVLSQHRGKLVMLDSRRDAASAV